MTVSENTPWLTIIGIGLDGSVSLSARATAALEEAEIVAGGKRHFELLNVPEAKRYIWPQPFIDGVAHIIQRRGRPVVVLATGDPMHFGIGSVLARHVSCDELVIFSSPSAFSLAAARLGWAIEDTVCISLHGRPLVTLNKWLEPGARILALTDNGLAPVKIAQLLCQQGAGESQLTVLENLGGNDEQVSTRIASQLGQSVEFSDLNVTAIHCAEKVRGDALRITRAPGLPDDAFIHDGQLTKREVRAATLAALGPYAGQHLWDVGAGCGSVAIEWQRSGARMSATAFECDANRLKMISNNAYALGVPELKIIAGAVPHTLPDIGDDGASNQSAPDAIFHGGAVSDDAVFAACWKALRVGGRMVANAVTLEGEAALVRRHAEFGGEIVRISIFNLTSVGQFRSLRPAMPVTQWRVIKS